MIRTWLYALGSVLLISLMSLVGAFALSKNPEWLEERIGDLVSLAAGILLGGAVVHLLPHSFELLGLGLEVPLYFLLGFVGFFLLERFLWHHHHGVEGGGHHHHHSHHLGDRGDGDKRFHPVVAMNLIGDGIHNFVDGMLIAAAFLVDPGLGAVTAMAVLLHELPQEIGDFGVLVFGGVSPRRALLFNFLSASMALAGAVTSLLVSSVTDGFTAILIPIAAGNFLYISAADLIPELHRDSRKGGLRHIWIFGFGLLLMVALRVGMDWLTEGA